MVSAVLTEPIVDELRTAALHQLEQILSEQVPVLLHHAQNLVHHFSSVVPDSKLHQVEPGADVEVVVLVRRVQLLRQGRILPVRKVALFIHQRDDTQALLDQVETLAVVLPLDIHPRDSFLAVLVLLQREDVLVEIFLQLLVRVVDVELFKVVLTEAFETEDIQHTNAQRL